MPPVGRPPAERNVYSFDGVLVPPAELVLETSFVVDALIPTQSRHAECRIFLENIALARSRVVFNSFLEAELWETAYQIALRELHPGKRAASVRNDRRTLRRAMRLREEVASAWTDVLSVLEWVVVDVSEVIAWLPGLMEHGLSASDAIHAATSLYADVPALVTLDYHFASAPAEELQLWVPANRLRACRERRRGQ